MGQQLSLLQIKVQPELICLLYCNSRAHDVSLQKGTSSFPVTIILHAVSKTSSVIPHLLTQYSSAFQNVIIFIYITNNVHLAILSGGSSTDCGPWMRLITLNKKSSQKSCPQIILAFLIDFGVQILASQQMSKITCGL